MKRWLKSANFVVVALICLLVLSGCADTAWPTWITGEPDDSVLNAPRIVGKPESLNDNTWPNLANIPPKPNDVTTPDEGKKQIQQMNADKAEAYKIRKSLATSPPIITAPLPYIRQ